MVKLSNKLALTILAALLMEGLANGAPTADGEAAATQQYMKETMQHYFHPPKDQRIIPYKAIAGWLHESFNVSGVPMEKMTRSGITTDRVLLQCHGGGYVIRLNDRYRDFAQTEAQVMQAKSVYTFDYRTAPQYTHPAALEDAVTAYRRVLADGVDPHQLIVVGDSAGGNLALALAVKIKELGLPQPAGIVLISPWTSMADLPSHESNRLKDHVLGENTPLYAAVLKHEYTKGQNPVNPELSPLYADLSGLPPLLIQTGSYETLFDDSKLLKEAADKYKVKAQLSIYKGMPHDFQFVMPELPQSQQAFKEMEQFANAVCGN